jgi:hypothetical protein
MRLEERLSTSGRMLVCLVCHTEPDVWDGGFASIDRVLPLFLEMLASVSDMEGRSPRVAWCLTGQVMRHRAETFLRLLPHGHEVGIHSHHPGGNGVVEHEQAVNRDHLDAFDRWFPDLCALAKEQGFPEPRTHASWMFAYRDDMTRTLARCGIDVDCSVCYGGAHHLPDGFLLADSRRRKSGKPYRLSEQDHCLEGTSPVVELPVSGGLGDYWEPDERGGFSHFSPIGCPPADGRGGLERQLQLFRARLDDLAPGEVDIYQIHFHLYEFLPPGGIDRSRLERARALLDAMASDARVGFAAPSAAVEAWREIERRG